MARHYIYPYITWKRFKKINKPFQGDLVPQNMDRILWQMLRDRNINIYFSDLKKDKDDPIILSLERIPKGIKEFIK